MTTLYDTSGRAVRLGAELGRGGEGAVFEVHGSSDLVAKVYHRDASPAKATKLARMAAARTDALSKVSAWPTAALCGRPGGAVRGLLMPRIVGHKEAHLLYSPKSRQLEFTHADYRFLVHAAANVARAFAVVHDHGHVVGDVNHSGVLVSDRATVTLIDCDSFQVRVSGEVFRCEVGVPEYTPPELQGRPLDGVLRTAEHDAFGLAVMVFHLLFMGRHPYVGTPTDTAYVPLAKSIAQHRFAYGSGARGRQTTPPPHTLPLSSASPPLAGLFERAFSPPTAERPRPMPSEWVTALDRLQRELRSCTRSSSHTYWSGLASCPWCEFERAIGFDYFPPGGSARPAAVGRGAGFDLDAIWSRIERVQAPPPLAVPTTLTSTPGVGPSRPAKTARALRMAVRAVGAAIAVVLGLVALGLFASEHVLASGVAGVAGWMLMSWAWAWEPQGIAKIKREATAARRKLASARAAIPQDSGTSFDAKKKELERAHQQLRGLAAERQRAVKDLQARSRERQLERFLSQHRVARCNVSGIGSGRKQTLISYGIETAADVTRRSVKAVPGFGPELTSRMVDWRRSIERRFRFDPTKKVDPADIAQIEDRFNRKQRDLQNLLLRGPSELETSRRRSVARYENLRRQAELVAEQNAQVLTDAAFLNV